MAPNARRNAPASTPVARSIQISKSLAWLLRHGAAKERVSITPAGYVNLGDVLAWHKLKALGVTFEEVLDVVMDNEKQRFGLLWHGGEDGAEEASEDAASGSALTGTELTAEASPSRPHTLALSRIAATANPDPRSYSIRAVQGHSIKTIDAESLLTPITLDNLPETCVHGTFFAAWPSILASRGLKAMTRNHVHFASGPAVGELGLQSGAEGASTTLKEAMERSSVVSGMRSDADVLIYVDVGKSMAAGMQWWRSENGVLLTEGVVEKEKVPSELEETSLMMAATGMDGSGPANGHDNGTKATPSNGNGNTTKKGHARRISRTPRSPSKPTPPQKLVPMEYWDMVVGIGVGILWQRAKGVVQEVPADLLKGRRTRMNSIGQGQRGKGRGGKGNEKPKVRVERDALGVDGFE